MSRSTTGHGELAVYPPREDTYLLLPFARVPPGTTVADVGTGSGLLALEAARGGARVVATDRNACALRELRVAARAGGWAVRGVRTDLLRGLGRFDRVLSNPPYLPTRPSERDRDPGTRLALDGGPDGCRVYARLVRGLAGHLAPGGSAYVVTSSVQDPGARAAIVARWERSGGRHEVVATRALEGEQLAVIRFWHPRRRAGSVRVSRGARRSRARGRGTDARRRTPRSSPIGSSRGPGRGRRRARGAASGRRRSPRGS